MQSHLIEQIGKLLNINLPSPVQKLDIDLGNHSTKLLVKRDDLIHPIISGNKFRKLAYNLAHCLNTGIEQIISFGGAYSNHLHALSYCCKKLDIQLTAIIRGERPTKNISQTLLDVESWGVKTIFIDRSEYKLRNELSYLNQLSHKYPHAFIIPEGGSNEHSGLGIDAIWKEISILDIDTLVCPIGSGGTFRGLMKNKPDDIKLVGVSALKGIDWYREFDVSPHDEGYEILDHYHFGGFAKYTPELIDYIRLFENEHDIALDQVYTAKMFFAIQDQTKTNTDWKQRQIIAIHTGGLQGRHLF